MDGSGLIRDFGQTYADAAGITLRDKPASLWQLLVLSLLLSARISSDIAVSSARELNKAGWRTPKRMLDSTWQQRVDALGRGGYRRYDERTATQLSKAAGLLLDRWGGDLRQLHEEAGAGTKALSHLLQEFNGIGPVGADIFLREAQGVWGDVRPFADPMTLKGAKKLGLSHSADGLSEVVPAKGFHRLVAACIRANLDEDACARMHEVMTSRADS